MINIVINRKCDTRRMEEFDLYNRHIAYKRFDAINGYDLDIDELIEKKVIERGLSYSRGALGSALSHMFLWDSVASSGKPACIFEDDAILCKNFEEQSESLVERLGKDWDIVLFGCNADTTLTIDFIEGITPSVLSFDQGLLQKNAATFPKKEIFSSPFRLIQTLGICGYALSPVGAKRLLSRATSLKNDNFFHYGLQRFLPNTSIDHLMANHYVSMNAFCALPFLCITKNDPNISTIL